MGARFLCDAYEYRFGTAHRGAIEQNSQMAGNAEASRVRVAVSVVKNQVRGVSHFGKGPPQYRNLAKTQQAWNIRKGQGTLSPSDLGLPHFRERVNPDGRDRHIPSKIEGHVRARYTCDSRKPVTRLETASQPQLDLCRFAGSYIPTMQLKSFHSCTRTLIGSWQAVNWGFIPGSSSTVGAPLSSLRIPRQGTFRQRSRGDLPPLVVWFRGPSWRAKDHDAGAVGMVRRRLLDLAIAA